MLTRPLTCPECGVPRSAGTETGVPLSRAKTVYSCPHYEQWCRESHCDYCDKPDSPVRQVPYSAPVSLCYCDDCETACREHFEKMAPPRRKRRSWEAYTPEQRADQCVGHLPLGFPGDWKEPIHPAVAASIREAVEAAVADIGPACHDAIGNLISCVDICGLDIETLQACLAAVDDAIAGRVQEIVIRTK